MNNGNQTKRCWTPLLLLVGLAVSAASPALAAEPTSVFEKLKALEGKWEGQRSDGEPAKATYQVFSQGSAVVENLTAAADENMVTVYHMDHNDLRLTHYCSAGNQPRLKANSISPDERVVSFEFVDATNLAATSEGHIHSLEITFIGEDRIQQKWTWRANGQEDHSVIQLSRVQ